MVSYSVISTNLSIEDTRFGVVQYGHITLRITVPAGSYVSNLVGRSTRTSHGNEYNPPTTSDTSWVLSGIPQRSGTFDYDAQVPYLSSGAGAAITWEFETSPITANIVVGNSDTYNGDFEYTVAYNGQTWNIGEDGYWYWNQIPYGAIVTATHVRSLNPKKAFTRWGCYGADDGHNIEGVVINTDGKTIEIVCTPVFHQGDTIIAFQQYRTATGLILHGANKTILHGAQGKILTDN